MSKIDLSLFDISTIEAKHKKRNAQKQASQPRGYNGYCRDEDNAAYECARPACLEPAYYKAPKSPQQLNEYRYFCLKHIQEHNKRWDYCENMSEQEIIDHLEKDMIGHRPTWQSGLSTGGNGSGGGGNGNARRNSTGHYGTQEAYNQKPFVFDDPFDLAKTIYDNINPQHSQKQSYNKATHNMPYNGSLQKIHDACQVLSIEFPPVMNGLRDSYKRLVKKYHPDINKTDKNAEQKLRKIVDAYKLISDFLGK